MATGGSDLAGTDYVTDQLLSHVLRHVKPKERMHFATEELGLKITDYENKQIDSHSSVQTSLKVRYVAILFVFKG